MEGTAPLIISSESNLAEEPVAVDTMKRSLWCTQTVFLSKQVLTTVAGRRKDAQTIKVSGAYTLLR